MFDKRLIFALTAVLVITVAGVIMQAFAGTVLDDQKMLALQGCGTCNGNQVCDWCDSWATGSLYCSGTSYEECYDTYKEMDCGYCDRWTACDRLYECTEPACDECKPTHACGACDAASGDDCED